MIFSKDLLFIHVPKTGGMSVSKYFLRVLSKPLFYSHPAADSPSAEEGVLDIPGIRHETLEEARDVVRARGFALERFPLILAAVRNPYAMEVSRYAYLQKGHAWDRGHNQDLALNSDFETFARHSTDHAGTGRPIQSYFLINDQMPENLRILRTENLSHEVATALAEIGIRTDEPFPEDNVSAHQDYLLYYSRGAEEAIYQRYRWIFDRGYYRRLPADSLPLDREPISCINPLPILGRVRQIGSATGFWHDAWVGPRLEFRVKSAASIGRLRLRGNSAHPFAVPLRLQIAVNGSASEVPAAGQGEFELSIACDYPAGTTITVSVKASAFFQPKDSGNSTDARELSFVLRQISFEPALATAG